MRSNVSGPDGRPTLPFIGRNSDKIFCNNEIPSSETFGLSHERISPDQVFFSKCTPIDGTIVIGG